jgi:hypothetical protein
MAALHRDLGDLLPKAHGASGLEDRVSFGRPQWGPIPEARQGGYPEGFRDTTHLSEDDETMGNVALPACPYPSSHE